VNEKVQNGLAAEVWKAERREMQDSFEGGPAANTVSQIQYQKYGTRRLTTHEGAGVYIKDIFRTGVLSKDSGPDQSYLSVMELGGPPAGPKRSVSRLRSAGVLPSGYTWAPARNAPKDRHGNLRGNAISDMLTSLGLGFVQADDPKYRFIYNEEQRPVGVARKVRSTWSPFIWFIPEPTYEGGNFLWTYTGELTVAGHFDRISGYYIDRALARHGG
jgi:hypothetical protein